MMRILLGILALSLIPLCTISCQSKQKIDLKPEYLRFVGDIKPDSILDNSSFAVCNEEKHLFQYFNTGEGLQYEGEKSELIKEIKTQFNPVIGIENQNGYIRIRFVINCKGESGRYRVLSSDLNYEPKKFDKAIQNELLNAVKKLKGWKILSKNDRPLDYYMYLIFKIKDGQIIEILP